MGTTYRRLQVEVLASAGGFLATMNRVYNSTTRVGAGMRSGTRDAGLFNKQIMAIGTTARYALAGSLVFGITSSIHALADFKTQLGEVDALAGQLNSRGQLTGLGDQLDKAAEMALLASNKYGIAVGEVEQYQQRFFSSFDPPGNAQQRVQEMGRYVDSILKLVTSLGTEAGDPAKLAGGLTGLINALPGGRAHPGGAPKTISDYFAVLLRQTPSLTGADIAGAAGRFASAKSLANMSVPQILATFGVAAQTGGSPAVIIRGITQLLGQSLLHPTRPASLRTYQAAGLPTDPNALASMGGLKVLDRLLNFVRQGGAPGTQGRRANLDAIYNAFSRQESVRQFVNLLAQGGPEAIQNFINTLHEGTRQNVADQMARRRLRQSTLIRMGQASKNLGLSLVSEADWPLEHLVADPLIGVSNFAIRHRTTTNAVVAGGLGLGAANALRRLGAFNRFGRLGGFLGAASGLQQAAISGAISKEELPAAIAGGAADGSRGNPYWVIISPLSWAVGSPGGFSQPVPGNKGNPLAWLKRIAGKAAGPAVGAGETAGLMAGGDALLAATGIGAPIVILGAAAALGNRFDPNRTKSSAIQRLLDKNMNKPMPGSMMPGLLSPEVMRAVQFAGMTPLQVQHLEVSGNAKTDMTIRLTDAEGRVIAIREKKGVPVKQWNVKQFPTKKGKPGSRKGTK